MRLKTIPAHQPARTPCRPEGLVARGKQGSVEQRQRIEAEVPQCEHPGQRQGRFQTLWPIISIQRVASVIEMQNRPDGRRRVRDVVTVMGIA